MGDNGDIRIVRTNDGSSTLQIDALNETYHSTHGAVQESVYVFVDQGFKCVNIDGLHILEVGFGTGLNALLTLLNRGNRKISYVGLETNPLAWEVVTELTYQDTLHLSDEQVDQFEKMHTSGWNEPVTIADEFQLEKRALAVQDLKEEAVYDLVYYDAFGPRAQSEMWEIPALEPVVTSMRSGGMLVTYCAQGAFKRNLKQLRMEVEELPGPPGKRQMTRASKP